MATLKTCTVLLCGLASSAACPALWASPGDTVAQITHLSGVLTAKQADGNTRMLSVKSPVREGDVLATENDAYARLKFIDHSEMVLRPNSVLKISEFTFREPDPKGDKVRLEMLKGGFRAVSGMVGKRSRESVSFSLPTATIGIRGTHLGALFCQNDCAGVPTPSGHTPANGLHLDVAAGGISVTPVTPPGGTPAPPAILNAGQFGFLPPPHNGVQPPMIQVPASLAPQVRMPAAISKNTPAPGASGKNSEPECVVQ